MGYQALYRRYRPARFEDFVGQEAVIKTLRSQITSGRIANTRRTAIPAARATPAGRWRRKTASIFWKSTRPATTAWTRSAICAKR